MDPTVLAWLFQQIPWKGHGTITDHMAVVTQRDPAGQAGPGLAGDRLNFPSFPNISLQAGAVALRDVSRENSSGFGLSWLQGRDVCSG